MTSIRRHSGYCYGKIFSKRDNREYQLKAHRVAWALYHDMWPDQDMIIDHINR